MGEYRLDELGWFQFERLCQTLLTVPYGMTIEVWGGVKDLGRDAYTEGSLRYPDPAVDEPGPFLFQAKFVESATALGRPAITRIKAQLKAEAKKIGDLIDDDAEWTAPRHYTVMTNVRVPPSRRTEVLKPIADVLPDARMHLLHEPQLEAMITSAPHVRLSFPQILSLRDLSGLLEEVVNRDLKNRADILLSDARELAAVFVPTRAYYKAIDTLTRHHFVVLTGPPEMGKTSIAKTVALAQAVASWDVVSCRGPQDFERAYKRDRPQIFVADDAFGSTEYRPQAADEWGASMGEILARVDARHWLAWTSRSAPLKAALEQLHLQDQAERFPEPGRVVVDATALTPVEKALMLYRHAKEINPSPAARELVREHALEIVWHKHFTPLRVRRFVRERLEELAACGDEERIQEAVDQELEAPTDRMSKSFDKLDDERKALLISMLDVKSEPTAAQLEDAYRRQHRGSIERSAVDVAGDLEEHFLRRVTR